MSSNKIEISVKDIPAVVEAFKKADKEIERLNNIIKEIEEYIKNRMALQPDTIDLYTLDKMTLIKLEELKGEKNE